MSDDQVTSKKKDGDEDIVKYIWVPDSLLNTVQSALKTYHIDPIEPPEKCWYLKVAGKKSDINQFIANCHEGTAHPENQHHLVPPNDPCQRRIKVENVSPLGSDLKS